MAGGELARPQTCSCCGMSKGSSSRRRISGIFAGTPGNVARMLWRPFPHLYCAWHQVDKLGIVKSKQSILSHSLNLGQDRSLHFRCCFWTKWHHFAVCLDAPAMEHFIKGFPFMRFQVKSRVVKPGFMPFVESLGASFRLCPDWQKFVLCTFVTRTIDSFVQEPRNLIGGDPGASNDDVGPGLGGTAPMGTVANLHAGPIKRDRSVRDVINQLPGENDMPHLLVDLVKQTNLYFAQVHAEKGDTRPFPCVGIYATCLFLGLVVRYPNFKFYFSD